MPEPATRPAGTAGPQQRTATQTALVDAFGGKRGLVDSGLPAIVFVFTNSVVAAFAERETALTSALVAAIVTGVAIVGVRLSRRQPLQQAVSGFLGIAIAAFFAFRAGEARAFFLPGIWINLAYGGAFLVSALVGRPVVGAVFTAVEGLGTRWRTDRRLRRAFTIATLGWALGVFGLRAGVQGALYLADEPGYLAAARLLMGWPLTILAVALTLVATRRVRAQAAAEVAAEPVPAP